MPEEINNFYTVTIYEKGAEVVRLYQTLLGQEGFRKGMDLYFQRHDGQAVTCDDFRAAMADANGRDLTQFEGWYSQAGTPRVKAVTHYDASDRTLTLTLSQSCPPTPDHPNKLPFLIPVSVGLVGSNGRDLSFYLDGKYVFGANVTTMLELTEPEQRFTFTQVHEKPVVSLLRNFSAPVILEMDYTDDELAHLMAHDSDHFNRWEAGQRLMMRRLLALTEAVQTGDTLALDEMVIDALRHTLNDTSLDPAFRELALTLPSETMIGEQLDVIDPQAIHTARQFMRTALAHALKRDFLDAYEANVVKGDYRPDPVSTGKRSLKNLALAYLMAWGDDSACALAQTQFDSANNMTDRFAALTALANGETTTAEKLASKALARFYREFKKEPLVIDKWFMLQASAHSADVPAIKQLMAHPDFTLTNPNRARSVIFGFCNANPSRFHAADGSGYAYWAEQVMALNALNPQVAARLARSMDRWHKFTPALQEKMKGALERVASAKKLSKDVKEVVTKALA
jgi:aminopeptidase N